MLGARKGWGGSHEGYEWGEKRGWGDEGRKGETRDHTSFTRDEISTFFLLLLRFDGIYSEGSPRNRIGSPRLFSLMVAFEYDFKSHNGVYCRVLFCYVNFPGAPHFLSVRGQVWGTNFNFLQLYSHPQSKLCTIEFYFYFIVPQFISTTLLF